MDAVEDGRTRRSSGLPTTERTPKRRTCTYLPGKRPPSTSVLGGGALSPSAITPCSARPALSELAVVEAADPAAVAPAAAVPAVVESSAVAVRSDSPYVSGTGNVPGCHAGSPAEVKVTGYYNVNRTEEAMAATVAKYGPVSIALDAMTQIWWPYKGGIVSNCCNKQADHAVLIVGYGIDNGQKYWLIKNSANWGENGYIRLERGSDQCGITSAPVQALVQGGVTPPPRPPPSSACPPVT